MTLMRDKSGCGTCATCCHSGSVARHFRAPNWYMTTQQNWPVLGAGNFNPENPEQAVLTGLGELPKPLSHGGFGRVEEGAEPSILSELPEVDLQFLVFLLRINFDTMAHFCKYRE